MDAMTMAQATGPSPSMIEWGVAGRALEGEVESGDACAVALFPRGALVAVADGLGHGVEAAVASRMAVATLEREADRAVTDLMLQCHDALRRTRGVAMSIASFRADAGTMTWLGVGNVEGVLFRTNPAAKSARESLLLRGGVVGYQMPPLRAVTLSIVPGDTLLLATDGIRADFYDDSPLYRDPQSVADDILARYAKKTDDALVLVIRCVGGSP